VEYNPIGPPWEKHWYAYRFFLLCRDFDAMPAFGHRRRLHGRQPNKLERRTQIISHGLHPAGPKCLWPPSPIASVIEGLGCATTSPVGPGLCATPCGPHGPKVDWTSEPPHGPHEKKAQRPNRIENPSWTLWGATNQAERQRGPSQASLYHHGSFTVKPFEFL
jgi:hypothetical protein